MFRLTREVRFAIDQRANSRADQQPKITNSHAGYPSLAGLGYFFTLQVTLSGPLDRQSQYLRNIKEIDRQVRTRGIELVAAAIDDRKFGGGGTVLQVLFELLQDAWPPAALDSLRLGLSPFLSLSVHASEPSMVRLSQKFEFSATHRLHNPSLTEQQNRDLFGKCNNPFGHGHNYEVQVTLAGQPDAATGSLIDIPSFEQTVATTVIDRLDHKNLNVEVPEFRELIPTVENIAMVIHRLLQPKFQSPNSRLDTVTVWETPKTWCEYGGDAQGKEQVNRRQESR